MVSTVKFDYNQQSRSQITPLRHVPQENNKKSLCAPQGVAECQEKIEQFPVFIIVAFFSPKVLFANETLVVGEREP